MSKVFALMLLSLASFAQASQYGCTVLLCLSNPASNGGPKGVSDCVAPINQLFRDLSKGKAFPSCDMADGNDGSSYAKQVFDPYDPCPSGLTPAQRLSAVVQGRKKSTATINGLALNSRVSFELQSQEGISQPLFGINPSRACVGTFVGSYPVISSMGSYSVNVYDRVIWQPMQNPRAIDIYMNNIFFQRVRY